ncbi:MAG TPA: hypothetical protein ENJ84_08635 [Gammaproteobacteria bacterium]|nr:hypothetical protein [Gammaproteobacteria bacterium]
MFNALRCLSCQTVTLINKCRL